MAIILFKIFSKIINTIFKQIIPYTCLNLILDKEFVLDNSFPFVNFVENQNGKRKTMFISNEDYCEVIYFLEETKMSMIV